MMKINMNLTPMKKGRLLITTVATALLLSACAQGVDAAKRLEKCVIDGNQNNNCELSTLEGRDESNK
ncbi:hypothetical protein [Ignatzschineria sp. F8392]|uniref:hypothetical protein n=1 Tax=Ignatzschineria sp. F8392 TaxID=1980117 RepID=UPI00117A2A01|nr:hypothetical protein [Ignatzschineria sp. F8392]